MPDSLLDCYRASEFAATWLHMIALGPSVRDPDHFDDAYAVALETMRRVRQNVERIHQRLLDIGYRFWVPHHAHVPPPRDITDVISGVEGLVGPLPLSLRAFYEVVGSVDFRQSPEQLVQSYRTERDSASELHILGEEDPLVVASIWELQEQVRNQPGRQYFCFAPDEFHKANYSGGENYHVSLPNPDADFRIEGMYDIEEYFVEHLRYSCAYGGFRGRVEPLPEDEECSRKAKPQLRIVEALAADLKHF